MKTRHFIQSLTLALLIAPWLPSTASAQTPFNSGSNGSYGPLNVTTNTTIPLPADGILHCTTVNVAAGATLKFTPNATNTPAYILATGDVTLNGAISLLGGEPVGRRGGAGGPGGFAGGQGGTPPSNGVGPGGGGGGWYTTSGVPTGRAPRGGGGFGTAGTQAGTGGGIYGNSLLIPLTGGAGGGGGDASNASSYLGGGGGGGAVLIASNTRIVFPSGGWNGNNAIYANGASGGGGPSGGGSGGAVRLVAPAVTGTVWIAVSGSTGGGFGRIRVDALTNSVTLIDNDGSAGYATFGANMVVFPTNLPTLRITQAAGQNIALTQVDPVFVLLPAGAAATQTVQVQVSNFNSVVPLVAVVTPEAGDRTTFNFDVDNTAAGAATGSVQVQIPAGVSTRIDVWTR